MSSTSRISTHSTSRTPRPKVTILGGGFAGLACANALDAKKFAVTLLDRKPHFEFLPNIHELVSGVKKPAQLRLQLRSAMHTLGHTFIQTNVTELTPGELTLRAGRQNLQSDYLLIAPGSADADYGISGVGEHTLGFKSVTECTAIGQRIRKLTKEKDRPRVVIVGGGLEGIEALGEVLRRYGDSDLRLTLVEAQESLLPDGPTAVGEHIAQLCSSQGVSCLMDDPVTRISAKSVTLASGRRLRSDATIWTGGPKPAPLLANSELAKPGDWAAVNPTLEHKAYRNVFVAGDAAGLNNAISKQAYYALDMGRCVAANIKRSSAGKSLRRFRPSAKPTLLAFGDIDTVLISERGSLAGPSLAAGKEAVYAAVMTQLDQRAGRQRIGAVLDRAKTAGENLLWPRLQSWQTLRRQTQLKRLS
ncbi:MAG: NAD(P)/FAD-dependent oxidoreductase [Congregibacter sp.]